MLKLRRSTHEDPFCICLFKEAQNPGLPLKALDTIISDQVYLDTDVLSDPSVIKKNKLLKHWNSKTALYFNNFLLSILFKVNLRSCKQSQIVLATDYIWFVCFRNVTPVNEAADPPAMSTPINSQVNVLNPASSNGISSSQPPNP